MPSAAPAHYGAQGEGNPQLNAPKLAGQGAGTLAPRQLPRISSSGEYRGASGQGRIRQAKWCRDLPATLGRRHRDKESGRLHQLLARRASRKGRCPGIRRRAEERYETCAYCHGTAAQRGLGRRNAPPAIAHERLVHEAPASRTSGKACARESSAGLQRRVKLARHGQVAGGPSSAINDVLKHIDSL